jgi:hypothetical protein
MKSTKYKQHACDMDWSHELFSSLVLTSLGPVLISNLRKAQSLRREENDCVF